MANQSDSIRQVDTIDVTASRMFKYQLVQALVVSFLAGQVWGAALQWETRAQELNDSRDDADCQKAYREVLNNFSSRTPSFFQTLNYRGAEYLFTKLAGVNNMHTYDTGAGNSDSVGRIGLRLRASDYKEMASEVCEVFVHALDQLSETASIPRDCRHRYLNLLRDRSVRLSTTKGISSKWMEEDHKRIAGALIAQDDDWTKVFASFGADGFEALVKVQDDQKQNAACSVFSASLIDHLTTKQREKVTASCLANMRGVDGVIIKHLLELPTSVFSRYNGGLTEETTRRLTAPYLKEYSSKLEQVQHCAHLSLPNLTASAMAGLTSKCLAGYLKHNPNSVIGRNLANAPTTAFKGNGGHDSEEEYAVVGKMDIRDYQHLSLSVVQGLINSPEGISFLHSDDSNGRLLGATVSKGLRLNRAQFNRLAERVPTIAGQVFAQAETLPDDVLSLCEPETIKGLIIQRGTELLVGFSTLRSVEHSRKNFAKIVSSMGDDAKVHICSTISTLSDYLDLTWLRPYVGDGCVRNLPFSVQEGDLKKAPELAVGRDTIWRTWLNELSPSQWKDLDVGLFAVFAKRTPDFCQAVASKEHSAIFSNLRDSHLLHVGGQCAWHLRSFISAQNAKKLAENAFSHFKQEDWKLSLDDVTDGQLPLISDGLSTTDQAKHVFSGMNKQDLQKLSEPRLLLLGAKQWGALSPETCGQVITVPVIRKLPARSLGSISDKHLDSWKEEVLLALSPEQIKGLGSEVGAKLKPLTKLQARLSDEQKTALAARNIQISPETTKEEASTGLSTIAIVGIVVGSIAGLVLIGAGIFFIFVWRRKVRGDQDPRSF